MLFSFCIIQTSERGRPRWHYEGEIYVIYESIVIILFIQVVDKFVANHPTMAKRQIELKINEIAVKEKRINDTKLVLSCYLCLLFFNIEKWQISQ